MADVAPRSERLCAAVVPAGRSTTRSWRTDTRLVIRPRCRPPVDRSYPPTSPGDYCLDRCRCSLEKPGPRPLEICSRDGLIRMSAGDLKRIALLSEVLVGRQAGDYLHTSPRHTRRCHYGRERTPARHRDFLLFRLNLYFTGFAGISAALTSAGMATTGLPFIGTGFAP